MWNSYWTRDGMETGVRQLTVAKGSHWRGCSCEVGSQHSPQLGTGVWVLKRGSGRCTTDSIHPVWRFRHLHSLSLTSKFTPSGGLLQNSVVFFPRKLPKGSY